MNVESLAKSMHSMQAVQASGLELWQKLGAQILHFPSATCIFSGIPSAYFNKVLVRDELAVSEFEDIFSTAKAKNIPYSWILPSHVTPELLKEHHFFPTVAMTSMSINLTNRAYTQPESKIVVKKVERLLELQTLFDIWKESYCIDEAIGQLHFERVLSEFQRETILFYLGYLEEKPIASGWLLLGQEYAGIYNIGTKKEFRNLGAATAMMYRLVYEAKCRGYPQAVLTALPKAKSIYEKMGFQALGEQTLYLKEM